MVAIVTGNGLGLDLSSYAALGARGTLNDPKLGQKGAQVFVNAANGNLLVDTQDSLLTGLGINAPIHRVYNSQGQFAGQADDWSVSLQRQITLASGSVNVVGSTIVRSDWDGSRITFTYDADKQAYIGRGASGATEQVTFSSSSNQWSWSSADRSMTETYDASASGRLVSASDLSGNTTHYLYDAGGRLSEVDTASGERTYLDYANGTLQQVRVAQKLADGSFATAVTVRYTYDSTGRLTQVTSDLTPDDGSIADGNVYNTTYTYDGASERIASISQSDGSWVGFTYDSTDAQAKVVKVSQRSADGVTRDTTIAYDGASRKTTVTDPLGHSTALAYDASGDLLSVVSPSIAGVSQTVSYTYDLLGRPLTATDAAGGKITYRYDAQGNLSYQRDAAGDVVERTYDSNNRLLTQTYYQVADPDGDGAGLPQGALSTRFVYDSNGHLRFSVSPDGRVSEYRYLANGLRSSEIHYAGSAYDVSQLGNGQSIAESSLAAWVGTADKSQTIRIDTTYDFRGAVASVTSYASIDANGNGVSDGTEARRQYVYDWAGRLVQSVDARGASSSTGFISSWSYDGLGRVSTATDSLGRQTVYQYDDAGRSVRVTTANGLTTTSTFDLAGEVVGITETSVGQTLAATQFWYDADGQLAMTRDGAGALTFLLYDAQGRQTAKVDGDGRLTEYSYDSTGNVTRTLQYANVLSSTQMSSLVDGHGNPVNPDVGSVRPTGSGNDIVSWNVFDTAHRLAFTVDGTGAVVGILYDGLGRISSQTNYSTRVSTASLGASPNVSQIGVQANAGTDRVVRNFYDGDGHLSATLDAEGFLIEQVYNAAGLLIDSIRYASATVASLRATGTLSDLRPPITGADEHTRSFYDAAGRKVGALSADGALSEFAYDKAGNVVRTQTYATRVTYVAGATLAQLRPAANTADQVASATYDGNNRVLTRTDASAVTTTYAYDAVGHLVQTISAASTQDSRTTQSRYDAAGRVIATLSGRGSAALAALSNPTSAQIDAIWSAYGVRYAYDGAGHRISATDALGNRTLFYYDAEGRLSVTINALGEVQQSRYDGVGLLASSTKFSTRISISTLSTMQGGVVDSGLAQTLAALANSSTDSVQQYQYDSRGALISSIDELGNATQLTYDAFGEVVTKTAPIGNGATTVTSYSYDRRGLRLIEIDDVASLSRTSRAVFDAFGRNVQQIDANGGVRSFSYDKAGRLLTSGDQLGNIDQYAYDALGRVVSYRDAVGGVTTTSYDTSTRTMTVTGPTDVTAVTTTNAEGEVWRVKDGNGQETVYQYDADGNLTSATSATGTVSKAYDNADRLISSVDANGVVTQFAFDSVNRVLRQTVDPTGLALVTTYAYDAKGERVTLTRPDGVLTQNVFDRHGNLTLVIVDPGGLNLQTSYAYDAQGRAITVTRAANTAQPQVTAYTFDGLGRRTAEDVDPSGLALTTRYEFDGNDNVTGKIDSNGNRTRYVYDAANRLVFTIDPIGSVTRADYDGKGRIVATTGYSNPINVGALSVAPTLAQVSALLNQSPAADRVTHTVFDGAGDATYSVDAAGFATHRTFDGNHNVVETTQYATAVPPLAGYDAATLGNALASLSNPAVDRTTRFAYDGANRLRFTVDAAGFVTEQKYDGTGNVVQTIAYANAVSSGGHPSVAQITSLLAADASRDRVTSNAFDANGRLVYRIDSLGFVTKNEYDGAGNVLRVLRYSLPIGLGLPATVAAIDAALPSNAADSAQKTERAYDSAGRLVFAVDAQGYVKETRYDGQGNIAQTVLYAQSIGVPGAYDSASIRAAVSGQQGASSNIVNGFNYDTGGRLVSSTDAEGHTESYTYDALGHKLTFTSKTGSVWGYSYDARGLLTSETSPVVEASVVDSALNLSTAITSSVTQFSYDAFGQLVFKTEAAGRPETRTTAYSYDRLGHQTMVQFPPVAIYDAGSDPLTGVTLGQRIERTVLPTTITTYDAFGDAVVNVDVAGNASYKTYDKLGRVTYDVDTESYVTQYTYDAFGNKLTTIRFAQRIDLSKHAGAQPLPEADVVSSLAAQGADAHASDRTITNSYDRLGRLIQVTEPAVFSYDTSAPDGSQYSTSARTTVNQYDAYGNLVVQTIESVPQLGPISRTFFFYDRNGVKTKQIDGLGYVTTFAYDAAGNLTSKTEFARAVDTTAVSVNGAPDPTPSVHDQPTGDATIGFDRMTTYSYDRLGNQLQEVRHGVQYSDVQNGTIIVSQGFTDAVTNYNYDMLGNRVSMTDAKGNVTYTYYDVMGRVYAVVQPARSITVAGTSRTASPVTVFRRDIFGNVVEQVSYALGASSASSTTFAINGASASDQVTYSFVDSHGNEVRTVDGEGINTYRSYDAFGHLARQWQPYSEGDGALHYKTTVYRYDKLGRQTDTLSPSDTASGLASVGTLSSANDNNTLLDEYGLIVNAFQNQSGRGDYFNAASGTSEGQFVLLRGAVDSFKATGDPKWKEIAEKMASNLLQALYFTDSPAPTVTATSLFAPHWLFNAKEDFVSDAIHYDKSFTVQDGTIVIPDGGDTHGELVRNVFSARTVGSQFVWDNPYSDLKSTPGAQKFSIASFAHVDGVGEVIKLNEPINGTYLVTYTTQTGEVIHKGEPYEAWPYWRKLQTNETDSALDVLSWAYDAFKDLYSLTSDTKWQNAASATLQTASIVYQFDDGRAWLHPTVGNTPFDIGGTYKSVTTGRAEPTWSRDGQGNAVIDIPKDYGDVQYGIGLDQVLDGGDIKVQIGSDRPMDVEVFIDTEKNNYLSRHSVFLHLAGTGVQEFRVKLSDFKPTYYTSGASTGGHMSAGDREDATGLAAGAHAYTMGMLVTGWPITSYGGVTQGKVTFALMRPWDQAPQSFVPQTLSGQPWISRTNSGNALDMPGSFSWSNRSNAGADVPVNWTRTANGDLSAYLGTSTSGESQYGIGIPETLSGTGIFLQIGSTVPQTLKVFLDPIQGDYGARKSIDVTLTGNGLQTIFIPFSQLGLTPGATVYTLGISDTNPTAHTLTLRQFGQYADGAPLTYAPAAIPFTANLTGDPQQLIGWRGPIYIGYQSPTMWSEIMKTDGDGSATDPNRIALNSLLSLMKAAQDDYQLKLGTRGPFTPAFYPNRTDGQQYGPANTFGWDGPDPNTRWDGYEYRALQETAKYWESVRGNTTAASITMDFLSWLNTNWNSVDTNPPTDFPENLSAWSGGTYYTAGTVVRSTTRNGFVYQALQTATSGTQAPGWPTTVGVEFSDGGVTWKCVGNDFGTAYSTYADPHGVALILRAAMFADLAGGDQSVTRPLIQRALQWLQAHRAGGDMTGTWSPDPANKTWYGFWSGEIATTLSLLMDRGSSILSSVGFSSSTLSGWMADSANWITEHSASQNTKLSFFQGNKEQVAYDAFGDITAKGVNDGWQEQYKYDNAGRLWASNQGGVNQVFLYNVNGQKTATIKSQTQDISGYTSAAAVAGISAGVVRTTATYDVLGRAIQVTQASFQNESASSRTNPTINYAYDRWNNVIASSDPRDGSAWTHYSYNSSNQLVAQVDPSMVAWQESGSAVSAATINPIKRFGYDITGLLVSETDANGNTTLHQHDAAGHVVEDRFSDGGYQSFGYDAFGRKVTATDPGGNVISYAYDRSDRMTAQISSVTSLVREYDELGNIVLETSGNGVRRYTYDAAGHLLTSTIPGGQSTLYAYDAEGHVIQKIDVNSNVETWRYDYFGRMLAHRDIGGADYGYDYDWAANLVKEVNSRGVSIDYTYYENDAVRHIYDNSAAVLGQVGGRGGDTLYEYDAAGNKTHERYALSGAVLQDTHTTFDLANRVSTATDPFFSVSYKYDAVGNRREVVTSFVDANGYARTLDYWYLYDSTNRMTVSQGVYQNGGVTISQDQGTILGYDTSGDRRLAQQYDKGSMHTEEYAYDAGHRLTTTKVNGAVVTDRQYDAGGRLTELLNYGTDGSLSSVQKTTYNSNGWLVKSVISKDEDSFSVIQQNLYQVDALGNVIGYTSYTAADDSHQAVHDTYSYTYAALDSYKETSNTATRQGGDVAVNKQTIYDANGNTISIRIPRYQNGDPTQKTIDVSSDYSGRVFAKSSDGKTQRYFYVNGASVGSNSSSDVGTMLDTTLPALTAFAGGDAASNSWFGTAISNRYYTAVSETYPPQSPATYTIQAGDTLRGIASAMFGDANLWYTIADANAIDDDAQLAAMVGQTIYVPPRVANIHNAASTFHPFRASDALGSLTLHLPDPPPKPESSGCGIVGMVIVAVVAIVATVVTAGAAAVAMGAAGAASAGLFAAGATALEGGFEGIGLAAAVVGGAVGSAVGQGVGIALGVQDRFSWSGVAAAAVGGGLSWGSGAAVSAFSGAVQDVAPTLASATAQGIARNALTQGADLLIGQQHRFDWAGLAASAISAPLESDLHATGSASAEEQTFLTKFGQQSAISATRSVATQFVNVLTHQGGRMSTSALVADAFGNAIGQSIVQNLAQQAGGQQRERLYDAAEDARSSGALDSGPSDVSFGNRVVSQVQAASVAKSTTDKDSYTDAVYSQMVDAFSNNAGPSTGYASGGMLFAGPGAPTVEREFMLPAMHVTPNGAWIDGGTGAAATGVAYGSGYDGAFSAWSPADLGYGGDVDLNAASFRSAMSDTNSSLLDSAKSFAKWTDQPIGWLEDVRSTAQRGNALIAEGLNVVGLHGLADIHSAWGDATGSSLPTRPWEIALSAPLLKGAAGPLLEGGAAMFGPKMASMAEGYFSAMGLRPGIVPDGPMAPLTDAWVRPQGWQLPKTNGEWTGVPGDSGWMSSKPSVVAITGSESIPFNKGFPDFSKWAQGEFKFDNLTGTGKDFGLVHDAIAQEFGLGSRTAAQNLLRQMDLTPHHVQDGVTIQLVPRPLNQIPHIGGASLLRNGM
jgi:YD repeat-containing protein